MTDTNVNKNFLLKLASDKSKQGRRELTQIILELFDDSEGALSDRERSLMYSILHNVVLDIEISLRKTIVQKIKHFPDLPPELVKLFASDEIDVAFPILKECGLLMDRDLIEIIQMRTFEHQLAIAMRQGIGSDVTDALVEHGNEGVIVALLQNSDADISQATLKYLVEQSKRVDSFQEPILNRNELSEDLAKRMYLWVNAALRNHICERFELDSDIIDDLMEMVGRDQVNVANSQKFNRSSDLANTLDKKETVSSEMLLAMLQQGEVSLFVSAFSKITHIKEYLFMRVLYEPGGEGLAVVCKSVDFDVSVFATLYTLSRKARASKRKDKTNMTNLLKFYDQIPVKSACEVVKMWGRGADYLDAIRRVRPPSLNP